MKIGMYVIYYTVYVLLIDLTGTYYYYTTFGESFGLHEDADS